MYYVLLLPLTILLYNSIVLLRTIATYYSTTTRGIIMGLFFALAKIKTWGPLGYGL